MSGKTLPTIVFIDHTPFAGGAQLVLAEHIAQLDKSRFQPVVICTDTVPLLVERYRSAGAVVEIINLPKLKKTNPAVVIDLINAVRSVRSLLQKHQATLVVSNTSRASYIATLAVLGSNISLIWWIRDYLYNQALFKLLQWRVAKIICVSKSIRNHYGLEHSSKAEVVYVASNLYQQLEKITPQQIQQERAKWGIEPTDTVIGFMGRLVKEKGILELAEAVIQLHIGYPQLKALIVGTGQNQQHNVEPQLQELIERHQAQSYLITTGYQQQEALYYSLFDIFSLNTIDAEPFATTVVQAMMAKKPVIGTACGGTPELVEEGITGLLVPPQQVDKLSQAIAKLLDQPQLAADVAQTGYTTVMAHHREQIATDQLINIYQSLIKS